MSAIYQCPDCNDYCDVCRVCRCDAETGLFCRCERGNPPDGARVYRTQPPVLSPLTRVEAA